MRVLIGSAYFESHRGGIEIVAGKLAREMQRQGATVTWFATDATPPPPADAGRGVARSIPAWNISERRLGVPMPLPGPSGIVTIWREAKAADAVHLHDSLYLTNVVAMLAARWHRKPVVITQHIAAVPYGNPLLRWLMTAANALIAKPMLSAADQVVFISETVAAKFAQVSLKAAPRLIFNGVDTDVFRLPPRGFEKAAARASLSLPADKPIVLFVGRFVEKKGLQFIEKLARRRQDLTFALAGWGPIDPTGWRLANVHVVAGLQEASLVPLYQASDVFVLPSVGEGLPLVLQEALACGLPVICGRETASADSDAGALIEGVEIDNANLEKTTAELSERIDRAMAANAAAGCTEATIARHAFVVSRYSWTQAAAAYLSIMHNLIEPLPTAAMAPSPRTP